MLAILADDLTSALDGAAPFANRGLKAKVVFDSRTLAELEADVVSLDLDSRFAEASVAEQRFQPLHGMLHDDLNLSPDQKQKVDALEAAYGERRREGQMREANAELAAALSADHAYTPRVQQAVDHFHHAMGELQKQTILHILAMRGVLTPAQTVTFDNTVARALVQSPA